MSRLTLASLVLLCTLIPVLCDKPEGYDLKKGVPLLQRISSFASFQRSTISKPPKKAEHHKAVRAKINDKKDEKKPENKAEPKNPNEAKKSVVKPAAEPIYVQHPYHEPPNGHQQFGQHPLGQRPMGQYPQGVPEQQPNKAQPPGQQLPRPQYPPIGGACNAGCQKLCTHKCMKHKCCSPPKRPPPHVPVIVLGPPVPGPIQTCVPSCAPACCPPADPLGTKRVRHPAKVSTVAPSSPTPRITKPTLKKLVTSATTERVGVKVDSPTVPKKTHTKCPWYWYNRGR